MAIWFQIALVLNLIYWTIFFYLLSRRRWTGLGLAVGIFHMFFASLVSVANFQRRRSSRSGARTARYERISIIGKPRLITRLTTYDLHLMS